MVGPMVGMVAGGADMSRIWVFISLMSLGYGIITGRVNDISNALLAVPEKAFSLVIVVVGAAAFWSGFMFIMQEVGMIGVLSKLLRPFMKLVFPKLHDKQALDYLSTNIAANMLGLGFAATPSGLKGIKRLKELSPLPEGVASDDMITFLVLNTSGVTLIHTTVIAIRTSMGAQNPNDFMFLAIISTSLSTVAGILADKWIRRPYHA